MAGLHAPHESHTLLLILSFTFYTLVSLGTLYLIGRSFLALGAPGLLLLECGVVLWSLAGTVGDFVSHGDANINVTIFNIGILLAGLCHLAGAVLTLRPQRGLRAKAVWLGAGCAFTLVALWLVSWAALSGWLPIFFIPGHGGTLVRYAVLISAITMFVLSAGVLHANQRAARLPFTSWYALALLLLAVGLFGIMIQLSLGSVVNWLSRSAQWLGGLYLLFAAIASLRESQLPLLPLAEKSHPAYYRDAVAMAVVLAAAAIRLSFLSALGEEAPFVTFYPAVMFASLYGGLRAGLLATALSAILADYFWIGPPGQLAIGQPSDWLAIMVFLLSGAMIAWVSDAMYLARERASAAEAQAVLAAERAKAAEALYEGRAKLEAALASMTDAVFISDVQGRFIDFNDAFATFHKFRNKDECAKTFAEYPDILDVFMPDWTLVPLDMWAVPRALRGETVTNAEYTLRRKDTGETWVGSYSFGPIRDKDGAIVGSVVVGRDITELKRSEEELRRSRDELEMRVQERTEELQTINEQLSVENEERLRVEIELRESENRLRELSTALLSAQERERKLIAQEIHDSLGASLAATKFKVESVITEMGDDKPQTRVALESVIPILQGTIEEARRIQMSLRPSVLDDLGILPTINWSCRQFESIYPAIRITREIDVKEEEVPKSLKIVIYRVLQEALNNIAKHSNTSIVLLSLRKMDRAIQLVIRDTGHGFNLEEAYSRKGVAKGLGLDSMRERTELSGGSFNVKSAEGKGTAIVASWPLDRNA